MHRKVYDLWKKIGFKYFWGDHFDSRFYIAYIMSNKKSKIVIDIGCGAGVLLHFTNSPFKIGLDYSRDSLKVAKKIALPNMEFIQADARYLPIRSNFFPLILAVHIISAFYPSKEKRAKVMNEIRRISSENGEIIIAGANRRSKHFKKILPDEYNQTYTHYSEIVDYFEKYFSVKVEGYGPYSKVVMYPVKIIFYKIPDRIIKFLKMEKILFRLLRSERFLKNGRSYIITCKNLHKTEK